MLIDAATLYYRAFHALPSSLRDSAGRPNNAIRGFFDGLRTIRDAHAADDLIVCWDEDWRPAWRVALMPSYKAERAARGDEVPPELAPQVPVIADLCRALGLPVVGQPGMEADDVIAALALDSADPVDVVSGDRDLLQLVSDARRRRLLYLGTGVGRHTVFDEALVQATHGVRPDQYADFASLRGDASDGLPGAPGIGAKTAATYLAAFDDLEGVLGAAAQGRPPITRAKAATLLSHADVLRATREVVTLRAATIEFPVPTADLTQAQAIAAEHGVSSTIRRWLE